jgi:branched-chain amino acid transport system substrate-binding protein
VRRSFASLGSFVTLSSILAACTQAATPIAPPAAGSPINIGAIVSLTGSQATAGQMVKEGYLFCQDWINAKGGVTVGGVGHPLNLQIEDDQSRPSLAADTAERLISKDHVSLLLGASANSTTAKAAPVAERHQVPMVSPGASADAIFNSQYHYLFSVLAPDSRQLGAIIDMALAQTPKPQSVSLLFASDSMSWAMATAGAAYASSQGLNVVSGVSYPSGVNDLRGQLGAVAAPGPDLIIEAGHPGESVRTVQQAQQMNIQPKLLAFTDGPGNYDFTSSLHSAANYSAGATQWTPSARTPISYFTDSFHYSLEYSAKFGHLPDQHSAAATAACLTLEVAIEQANSTLPNWVRDSLGVLDFNSFFGEIKFDGRGANMAKSVYVEQVQGGRNILVWPPTIASSRPRYPDPGWAKR